MCDEERYIENRIIYKTKQMNLFFGPPLFRISLANYLSCIHYCYKLTVFSLHQYILQYVLFRYSINRCVVLGKAGGDLSAVAEAHRNVIQQATETDRCSEAWAVCA